MPLLLLFPTKAPPLRGPRRTRLRTRLFARAYACVSVQRGVRRGRSSFSPQRLRLCGDPGALGCAPGSLRGLTPAPPYSAACGADAPPPFPRKGSAFAGTPVQCAAHPALCTGLRLRRRTARRAARMLASFSPQRLRLCGDPGALGCAPGSLRGLTPAPPYSAACGADAAPPFPRKGSAFAGTPVQCAAHPALCTGLRLRRRTARRAARTLLLFPTKAPPLRGPRRTRLRTRLSAWAYACAAVQRGVRRGCSPPFPRKGSAFAGTPAH